MNFELFFQHYGQLLSLVLALLYFHNQNVAERRASDDRWANLKTETDDRFKKSDDRWAALKSETDDRWSNLKSEGDNRWAELQKQWAEGQKEITALMRRMNMIQDNSRTGS